MKSFTFQYTWFMIHSATNKKKGNTHTHTHTRNYYYNNNNIWFSFISITTGNKLIPSAIAYISIIFDAANFVSIKFTPFLHSEKQQMFV